MERLNIKGDFIKLGQALKLKGVVESGVDAKHAIKHGIVLVNGRAETRRGRKLVDDDAVTYNGETFVIRAKGVSNDN